MQAYQTLMDKFDCSFNIDSSPVLYDVTNAACTIQKSHVILTTVWGGLKAVQDINVTFSFML